MVKTLALYLVLEGGTAIYVGRTVVYHTVCEYKELYTDSDKRYRWYVQGIYQCPPYVRHKTRSNDDGKK